MIKSAAGNPPSSGCRAAAAQWRRCAWAQGAPTHDAERNDLQDLRRECAAQRSADSQREAGDDEGACSPMQDDIVPTSSRARMAASAWLGILGTSCLCGRVQRALRLGHGQQQPHKVAGWPVFRSLSSDPREGKRRRTIPPGRVRWSRRDKRRNANWYEVVPGRPADGTDKRQRREAVLSAHIEQIRLLGRTSPQVAQ